MAHNQLPQKNTQHTTHPEKTTPNIKHPPRHPELYPEHRRRVYPELYPERALASRRGAQRVEACPELVEGGERLASRRACPERSRRAICLLTLSLLALTCNPIDRTWSAQCKNCFEIPGRTRNLKKCLTKELVKTKDLINTVDACDQSIPISAPIKIENPGVYCLIADINGSIKIDADNVTLNLNNHTITSNALGQKVIEVENVHSNITIKNGIVRVQNEGVDASDLTIGLLVNQCTNLKITDISFEGDITKTDTIGCRINDTKGIRIDRCSFTSTSRGLEFDGSSNGKITCCIMRGNAGIGCFIINNSSNLIFEQVEATNSNVGFLIELSNNCNFLQCRANDNSNGFSFRNSSDCLYFECEANQNQTGFFSNPSKKLIFDSCRAMNNGSLGFNIFDSQKCCIKNCLAKKNNIGFRIGNSSDNYITNNKAIGNDFLGFSLDGTGANNVFLSNYAEGNGTNYFGGVPFKTFDMSTGTFASPTPSAWDNISATP